MNEESKEPENIIGSFYQASEESLDKEHIQLKLNLDCSL
jgi:hypothetical protein